MLVPTEDNYRLVGAVKTKVGQTSSTPLGAVIEERVEADTARLARGRYRVTFSALDPGEYALVLRPRAARNKKRGDDATLGELLGGVAGDVLYITWDFRVAN
jgi:hypothetical protein